MFQNIRKLEEENRELDQQMSQNDMIKIKLEKQIAEERGDNTLFCFFQNKIEIRRHGWVD